MSNVVELVKSQEELFLPAVVDGAVEWQKECQFAIQAFQGNDFLAKTALSNPTSAQNAIINIAAIGVSLNPALKHAYLVPRKNAVCLDISYMGMLHIAIESGSILWGQAEIIRANDKYKKTGFGNAPIHEYEPFCDRGEIVGVCCVVKLHNGDYLSGEMNLDAINAIKNRSESAKKGMGPWVTDFEEMAKKTIVKREYKYWPKAKRLDAAIQYQNTIAGEGIILDQEPIMPHTSNEEAAEAAKQAKDMLIADVQVYIDKMQLAQSSGELQGAFAPAYRMTKHYPDVHQQVQKIYADNKARIL